MVSSVSTPSICEIHRGKMMQSLNTVTKEDLLCPLNLLPHTEEGAPGEVQGRHRGRQRLKHTQ